MKLWGRMLWTVAGLGLVVIGCNEDANKAETAPVGSSGKQVADKGAKESPKAGDKEAGDNKKAKADPKTSDSAAAGDPIADASAEAVCARLMACMKAVDADPVATKYTSGMTTTGRKGWDAATKMLGDLEADKAKSEKTAKRICAQTLADHVKSLNYQIKQVEDGKWGADAKPLVVPKACTDAP